MLHKKHAAKRVFSKKTLSLEEWEEGSPGKSLWNWILKDNKRKQGKGNRNGKRIPEAKKACANALRQRAPKKLREVVYSWIIEGRSRKQGRQLRPERSWQCGQAIRSLVLVRHLNNFDIYSKVFKQGEVTWLVVHFENIILYALVRMDWR